MSQGAKPGLGGVLPAAKVTREIADIRGIPLGKDCISPSCHSAFSDVDSLLDFVEMLAADNARQSRQRHDPLRDDCGMRRDAVVGQAIPGWEFQDFNIGREEGNRPRDRSHAWAVAADERKRDRRRIFARRNGAGEIGDDEPFRAIRYACDRERSTGFEPLGRRFGQELRRRAHDFASTRL